MKKITFLILLSIAKGLCQPSPVPFTWYFDRVDKFSSFVVDTQQGAGYYYFLERKTNLSNKWEILKHQYIGVSQTNLIFTLPSTNNFEFYRVTRLAN